MKENQRWVSVWGNAVSVAENRPERHAYNHFIRTTDLIDGCIDFDVALRDPARPDWFLPAYDSGDHLHPSKAGYERMALEIPESLLK